MSGRTLLSCNYLLAKCAGPGGAAGTGSRDKCVHPSSLLLQLLQSLWPPLIWPKSLPRTLRLGLVWGLRMWHQASPGKSPAFGQVYRFIGLYLQNTSSQIKLLGISRQQQQQSIKLNAKALASMVSARQCVVPPSLQSRYMFLYQAHFRQNKDNWMLLPLQVTGPCNWLLHALGQAIWPL